MNEVAKARRRYLKHRRKSQKQVVPKHLDTHHLCFMKKRWNYGELVALRNFWYCKAEIPKNTLHHYIHQEMNCVPPPKPHNAREALDQLRTLEKFGAIRESDDIKARLKVLIALFDCIEQPTADAFKKQLEIVNKFQNPS